jgi:predicted DNA-binding protein (UPF0251 family)
VYNRPFDDQTQPRIALETQALNTVLQLVQAEAIQMVNSSILEYENSRNRFAIRREWVERQLQMARSYQAVNEAVVERAQELEQQGL